MAAKKGVAVLWHRHDTAASFASANPTLGLHEWGIETDTGLFKIGDGSTAWTSLNYIGSGTPTASGGAIATTAATNSSPYGYSQAQADGIRALINTIRTVLIARGFMS